MQPQAYIAAMFGRIKTTGPTSGVRKWWLMGARLAPLIALSLVAAGCAQELKSLSALNVLRNALAQKYEHEEISVTVQNGTDLGIHFINSQFNALDDAGQRAKAQEIALFARAHFPSINQITRIWVAFLSGETRLYVFHSYVTRGVFTFDKDRIEAGDLETLYARDREARTDTAELKAVASYAELRNETTVSVNHLQLYGTLDDGLVLLPEFVVSGRKITPPEYVDFEFVSYSKHPVFTGDRSLTLFADGARVTTKKPRLSSTGQGEDGTYSEVISHRLSYKEFFRLVNGRDAKLQLGTKEIELSEEHLRLLREMKTCVDEASCP